jgi:hypothetical protein
MGTKTTIGALTLLAALTIGCGGGGQEPEVDPGVINDVLQIRLTAIPSEFVVTVNEDDRLELEPSSQEVAGRVWFTLGPEDRGVNLVAAVRRHQRHIEEFPQADYKGGQELVTPLGTAFYSRGRYLAGLTETEETAVFIQHPTQTRLLTISYRYPADVDSSVRVQQLLDVLGEVDGIHTTAE